LLPSSSGATIRHNTQITHTTLKQNTAQKLTQTIHELIVLSSEYLHNLYTYPSIIRMIKSRKMRWAGHVAHMEERGIRIGFWWESLKERDQ
jgi:hypothetical protein